MSGTITPPPAIDPAAVARQTLVYGDRPFVDPRTGFLTNDAYQLLSRLTVGFGTTVENVGTVITNTNSLATNITEVNTELTTINEEIQNNTTQILNIQADPGFPPTPPMPPISTYIAAVADPLYPAQPPRDRSADALPLWPDPPLGLRLSQVVGIAFFFGGGW